jgi:hypothetical protein
MTKASTWAPVILLCLLAAALTATAQPGGPGGGGSDWRLPDWITAVSAAGALVTALVALYAAWKMNGIAKEQSRSAKQALEVQTFFQVFEFMERVREQRAEIRALSKVTNRDADQQRKLNEAMDQVCRAFDALGLLDRKKLIREDLVDQFYASPLVILWDEHGVGDYVELLRTNGRGATHFWELVKFYERVKRVPVNHPGRHAEADWCGDPRTRIRP